MKKVKSEIIGTRLWTDCLMGVATTDVSVDIYDLGGPPGRMDVGRMPARPLG
jgi:hypothetical protein